MSDSEESTGEKDAEIQEEKLVLLHEFDKGSGWLDIKKIEKLKMTDSFIAANNYKLFFRELS